MPRIVRSVLLIGVPSIGGYYSGRYIGGSGFRAQSEEEMTQTLLDNVPDASIATLKDSNAENQAIFSTVVKTTNPQKIGDKTVSYAYCGQKSVGFPAMVHGGLLATLIKQQVSKPGDLTVKYLKPTFIEQVLRLETSNTKNGHEVVVYSLEGSTPLVKSEIAKQSWSSCISSLLNRN